MKTNLLVFIIFLVSLHNAFGQNDNSYAKAEIEINSVYQKILREYATDKEFIKNLRTSQRLWIQFRDAEVRARYPQREPGYYGSVHSMCLANLKTELTNERIKVLRVWLTGIEEGDVCAGSVKRKY
ncbi:lysozyme inhibitor LprI family protein [Dyadobacter fanqingshengii]|uniref:DUF1311 domain-containing protein n=1 Tax=Dyadobacter fanqingshengii TaxID=2906443 RepID=A0A9X1P668_9BACT|nr:lysozyme inhibitor LprI family protein [Dyadobacter fanqingshengii]MCF0038695.1 DUF1311 domain-containing protein [Dyadobacter fanqingshengii]USJ34472.1 DUF1311 domain-containing protein [Dyadobacter fanqingshengii]